MFDNELELRFVTLLMLCYDDVSYKVKQLIKILLQIQQMKLLWRKKALLVKKSMQYTV